MNVYSHTQADKIILALSVLLVITQMILIGFNYSNLPETIPVHFGIGGVADSYGPKRHILFLFGIGLSISSLIFYMQTKRAPPGVNYWPYKPENKQALLLIGVKTLRIFLLLLTLLFTSIIHQTIQIGLGKGTKLNSILDLIIILLIPVVLILSLRGRK